jgi:hypothetical protein
VKLVVTASQVSRVRRAVSPTSKGTSHELYMQDTDLLRFGHDLTEIVDHLIRARGCHWPIFLTAIDQKGEMLLLTIKTDWAGIIVHYPPKVGSLHMSLYPPVHLLLVDGDGRTVKATMMDTGGWLHG